MTKIRIKAEDLRKKLNIPDIDVSAIIKESVKQSVEEIKPLMPVIPKQQEIDIKKEIKIVLPNSGYEIKQGLELLQGNDRLDKSAIKGIEDLERLVRESSFHSTGGGSSIQLKEEGSLIEQDIQSINFTGIPVSTSTDGIGNVTINIIETDPVFSAWLITTPPLYSETDPIWTADKQEIEFGIEHKLGDDIYYEPTITDGNVTQVDYYTDSGKLTKLFTKVITYTSDKPTSIVMTDEITSKVLTTTITYSGDDVATVTKALT